MRKALQITALVLVASFLLYLIPPVRQFIDENLTAQVAEMVQLEICYDSCTPDTYVCLGTFVPLGTCSTSTQVFNQNAPSLQCDTGEVITTYVSSAEECTSLGGVLVDDTSAFETVSPYYGLQPIDEASYADGLVLLYGEPVDISEIAVQEALAVALEPSIAYYYEVAQPPLKEEALLAMEYVIGYDFYKSFAPNIELENFLSVFVSQYDDYYYAGGSIGVDTTSEITFGSEIIDTTEQVLLGGVIITDPAGAGYEETKVIVDEALSTLSAGLTEYEEIYNELISKLGLTEPLGEGMQKVLDESVADYILALGDLSGSAPTTDTPSGGTVVVGDPSGTAFAGDTSVIVNGQNLDLGLTEDIGTLKDMIHQAIASILLTDVAYQELLKALNLEEPLTPSLEEIIKACLQGLAEFIQGEYTHPATTGGGTVVDGGSEVTTGGGTTTTGGGTTTGETTNPPPEEPVPPTTPEDPPPEGDPVPPTGEEEICPNCPSLHLWDAGAAHDAPIPTHYEWDGPHFHVGRLNPNIQTQEFIKIEEPVVWLGVEYQSVDGEIEPHCCDDEDPSVDQNGLLHGKSNREVVSVYLDHIVGAGANPALPPTTHLGTLIIARYERQGTQDYDFYVIDAKPIRYAGEHNIPVNNDPRRGGTDLLGGEGYLRVIYMGADEENYGFQVEEIEDDWDGTHSKLMEIINLPAFDPFDPSIPPGEIEDYWYGEDCAGNFGFFDPMYIPYCDQQEQVLIEPGLDDKLNITFICTQTQSQTCGNDNTAAGGNFGTSLPTPANNGPIGDFLSNLIAEFRADAANNTPKIRLEKMHAALVAALSAAGNTPSQSQ